jgi:hypothetical protein
VKKIEGVETNAEQPVEPLQVKSVKIEEKKIEEK